MMEEPKTFSDWLAADGLYWLCENALTHEFMLAHDYEGACEDHGIPLVPWPYDTPDGERIVDVVWETLYAARTEVERHFGFIP